MKGRLPDEFRERTKRFTKALEAESSELIAIFTTMINRTRDRKA
jgi:hypothetical protein